MSVGPWQVLALMRGKYVGGDGLIQNFESKFEVSASVPNDLTEDAGTAQALHKDTVTVAASSNDDIDLTGDLNRNGPLGFLTSVPASWSEIAAIIIKSSADNDDTVTITPGATNGLDALFGASGSVAIEPGDFVMLRKTVTVDASNKVINIANASSGSAADVEIIILGH